MTAPRIELATLPTPLVRARRLEEVLASGPLYVKRDDLTGFATAGNKARALEFLIGDALARSADVLVAAGSASSNFCPAAALAAGTAGLDCDLLFCGPEQNGPNIALARAAGARLLFDTVATREQLDAAVDAHADDLRAAGRRPYAMPRGGATAVGALGYAHAARELAWQCEQAGIAAQTIVVATGSGGTQAGLVAGTVGFGLGWRVVGASVSRPAGDVAERILSVARACAAELGVTAPARDDVEVRDLRGPGFGVPSDDDRANARLALLHEALLLDQYYGAKAMTLLRRLLAEHVATPVVFWHTGGVVAALAALNRGGRV